MPDPPKRPGKQPGEDRDAGRRGQEGTILDQPAVTEAMVFTMVHSCGFVENGWPQGDECSGCPGPSGAGGYPCQALVELCAKGCAVRDAFGAAALGQG